MVEWWDPTKLDECRGGSNLWSLRAELHYPLFFALPSACRPLPLKVLQFLYKTVFLKSTLTLGSIRILHMLNGLVPWQKKKMPSKPKNLYYIEILLVHHFHNFSQPLLFPLIRCGFLVKTKNRTYFAKSLFQSKEKYFLLDSSL